MSDFETSIESEGRLARTVEEARALHHLASADTEVERDGSMTGPAHEEKYGLERAEGSAAAWRAQGVHPTENRALVGDEDGAENLRGIDPALESTAAPAAPENTAAPAAKPAAAPAS
jgi:hypothetical protein